MNVLKLSQLEIGRQLEDLRKKHGGEPIFSAKTILNAGTDETRIYLRIEQGPPEGWEAFTYVHELPGEPADRAILAQQLAKEGVPCKCTVSFFTSFFEMRVKIVECADWTTGLLS